MNRTSDQGNKDTCPQITLITKRDVPALMSKRISLDLDGKLKSDGSECRMVAGTARAFAETAADLARIIQSCGSNQAIALGALKENLSCPVKVTTNGRLDQNPGAIVRARDSINYRSGYPAWALIDFDSKGMPDDVKTKLDAAGGMWNALLTVAPGPPQFEECKHLAECETAESSDVSRYLSHRFVSSSYSRSWLSKLSGRTLISTEDLNAWASNLPQIEGGRRV
jgi:hypothetical protein